MLTTNDPISDLLTRIRNALTAKHRFVDLPNSRMNLHIATILKEQGFVEDVQVKKDECKFGVIRLFLKYGAGREPVIHGLTRQSKPGRRKYVSCDNLPMVCGGLGISIVSTSKGVMVGHEAKKSKVGGELLCYVW
jgi:small subunit ribosomal protein S8